MDNTYEVEVGPEAAILIPAEIRRKLGILAGSSVVIRALDGGVTIVPMSTIKRRLQDMFADIDVSMADELIAERRAEAISELGDGHGD